MGLRKRTLEWAVRTMTAREPDFVIGDNYLKRWYITPWSGWYRGVSEDGMTWWKWLVRHLPNVYLHDIQRDDDDRALHDHPWLSLTWVLFGEYWEITKKRIYRRGPGSGRLALRRAAAAHRIEVKGGRAITLFITGPMVRQWGFHCPQGWRHWRVFTDPENPGQPGRGCD